jgi:hypothetical protein
MTYASSRITYDASRITHHVVHSLHGWELESGRAGGYGGVRADALSIRNHAASLTFQLSHGII